VTFSGDCTNAAPGQGAITLAAGDAKTCVITRLGPPTLTIALDSVPQARSGDMFNGQLDGVTVVANAPVTKGGVWTQAVAAGRHKVAETAGTGTNLANYTVLMQGDCGPDGSVTVAQDGKVRRCQIENVPAYQSLRVSMVADPGQNSGATLQLMNNSAVLQTITLKNPGDPAWSSLPIFNQTFQLNAPLQFTDISLAIISLVPAGAGDTMHVSEASLELGNPSGSGGSVCVISRQWESPAVVTPSLTLGVDDPDDGCDLNLPTPVLSLSSGTYTCPQTVTITGDPFNPPIFVTTDGSRPTGRSPPYLNPLTVGTTETIYAIALSADQGFPTRSKMTGGRYICATPPVCPSGQHCCSGATTSEGCIAGCVPASTQCLPLCAPGLKCCGGPLPNGRCDDRCVAKPSDC
jgi:hypothetical protein